MESLLQDKLDELKQADDFECWYLVKQETDFGKICYLVSFLKEYQESGAEDLENFINKKEEKVSQVGNINYRALRVGAFYGLITMKDNSPYDQAIITETFEEINKRCNGAFENKSLYEDIIERQIEKMYISSEVDQKCSSTRKDYRLYPVMLLYKILLELGRSTGRYYIDDFEYRYLVATTKKFEDFLDTLVLINLYRKDPSVSGRFEKYKGKVDNRLSLALRQLPALDYDAKKGGFWIKQKKIKEVAKKVFFFETNHDLFKTGDYLTFLGSTKSLLSLGESNENVGGQDESATEKDKNVPHVTGGTNVLLYGVPGCGKSYTLENMYCHGVDQDKIERVVFHPDYTYGDFVGQILPSIETSRETGEEKIRYEFSAGPFTRILKSAYDDPREKYYLIIEEINRGNAPAIFGDIFQLLDREKSGESKYKITNADVAKTIYNGDKTKKIGLPSNLSVFATMNTSDQNVFTLDTAFQRRWNMRLIENDVFKTELAQKKILDTSVTWGVFVNTINRLIIDENIGMGSSEDKRLGAYFVAEEDLNFFTTAHGMSQDEADNRNRRFPEKVLKYLWDDAFKYTRETVFNTEYKTLEELIKAFENAKSDDRFGIFMDVVLAKLTGPNE